MDESEPGCARVPLGLVRAIHSECASLSVRAKDAECAKARARAMEMLRGWTRAMGRLHVGDDADFAVAVHVFTVPEPDGRVRSAGYLHATGVTFAPDIGCGIPMVLEVAGRLYGIRTRAVSSPTVLHFVVLQELQACEPQRGALTSHRPAPNPPGWRTRSRRGVPVSAANNATRAPRHPLIERWRARLVALLSKARAG
jgi:hypothetical protein